MKNTYIGVVILAIISIAFLYRGSGNELQDTERMDELQVQEYVEPNAIFVASVEQRFHATLIDNKTDNIIYERSLQLQDFPIEESEGMYDNSNIQYHEPTTSAVVRVLNVSNMTGEKLYPNLDYYSAIYSLNLQDENGFTVLYKTDDYITDWVMHPKRPELYFYKRAKDDGRDVVQIWKLDFRNPLQKPSLLATLPLIYEMKLSADASSLYAVYKGTEDDSFHYIQIDVSTGDVGNILTLKEPLDSFDPSVSSISPSGKMIAYHYGSVDIASENITPITRGVTDSIKNIKIHWSAMGDKALYIQQDQLEIYDFSKESTTKIPLSNIRVVAWNPSQNFILYSDKDRTGPHNIMKYDLQNKEATKLLHVEESSSQVQWVR